MGRNGDNTLIGGIGENDLYGGSGNDVFNPIPKWILEDKKFYKRRR